MDFFITGYPRSKTAWLANWFTYLDSFCIHDGIEKGSMDRLREIRGDVGSGVLIGNSDCGNCIWWKEFSDAFPKAKWVIVERDLNDVNKSISEVTGYDEKSCIEVNGIFTKSLEEVKRHLNPFILPFDFNSEKLEELCQYLDVDFSLERYYTLRTLNIQVTKDRVSELLTQY